MQGHIGPGGGWEGFEDERGLAGVEVLKDCSGCCMTKEQWEWLSGGLCSSRGDKMLAGQ